MSAEIKSRAAVRVLFMSIRFGLVLLICALTAGASWAQTGPGDSGWPNKPVRFIVPFPAGSSTDVVARIVGQLLGSRLGQQFVIENRVGASGALGSDVIARAAPDGYTVGLATTSTHALSPNLNAALPYDAVNDFAPVSMIGSAPYVMVIYPGLEARSVQEFVALAKAKPGQLNYGSAGPASLAHLAGVLFANTVGVQITHVPYKSSAQSVTDIVTGRLDMQFSTIAPTQPLIRTGQLRALAVTGLKRSGTMPELPTLAESGLPGYDASLWMGLVMPSATPADVIQRLNRALTEVLSTEEAKATLLAQGVDTETTTPNGLRDRIRTDKDKWHAIIAKAAIRAE
jgi:tripartite-type tricarboxylate transporter receptor subunit TctC